MVKAPIVMVDHDSNKALWLSSFCSILPLLYLGCIFQGELDKGLLTLLGLDKEYLVFNNTSRCDISLKEVSKEGEVDIGKLVITTKSVRISAETAKRYGFVTVPSQSSQLQRKEIYLADNSAIIAVNNGRDRFSCHPTPARNEIASLRSQ